MINMPITYAQTILMNYNVFKAVNPTYYGLLQYTCFDLTSLNRTIIKLPASLVETTAKISCCSCNHCWNSCSNSYCWNICSNYSCWNSYQQNFRSRNHCWNT